MKHRVYSVEPVDDVVVLHCRSGETFVYNSYQEFLYFLRRDIIERTWINFKTIGPWDNRLAWYRAYDYVVEYSGKILHPDKILADWKEYNDKYRRVNRNSYWFKINHRNFTFRYDPVPYIHKFHGHKGSFYKKIHTTPERRASLAAKEDGVQWRGKRSFHNLPNSWDDYPRKIEKNWKKFRKHQWKDK